MVFLDDDFFFEVDDVLTSSSSGLSSESYPAAISAMGLDYDKPSLVTNATLFFSSKGVSVQKSS